MEEKLRTEEVSSPSPDGVAREGGREGRGGRERGRGGRERGREEGVFCEEGQRRRKWSKPLSECSSVLLPIYDKDE